MGIQGFRLWELVKYAEFERQRISGSLTQQRKRQDNRRRAAVNGKRQAPDDYAGYRHGSKT